ncbi:MAG: hypothetical protein DCF25_11975 [Leptolyngbya foveolarum]|uniref:Uncharacterized protein n=1 Tax=Leptolyngbya foveolarum TaxID=47253 RepID=A0A2W4U768_9CYAN|nr:MAG: hypothetical protein DCF25_11975 [Leptolyngbya foveolarum]
MEDTDSKPKQAAVDGKSAYAGNAWTEPTDMGVDKMGTEAGLDVQPEEPLAIAEELSERDEERYELNPDSANRPAVE